MSVVIACYNYGRFLENSVLSALLQTGVAVDVTVVDDASTDGSLRVAEELVLEFGIRLLRHRENQGYIASYNEALAGVTGEFVVKLDADDLLPAGALARSTALLRANPDVGFAYGRPWHFSGQDDAVPPAARSRGRRTMDGTAWLERRCRSAYNTISNPEVTMRASSLRAVGLLDPALRHTCDLELWLRLAAHGAVGYVDGPYQGCYRVHGASMQRTVNAGPLVDLRGRRDAFDTFFRQWDDPSSKDRRMQVHRVLARQALDAACRSYDRGRVVEEDVDALVAFADDLDVDIRALRTYRALRRRQRLGPGLSAVAPPFLARAAARRLVEEARRLRWQRSSA